MKVFRIADMSGVHETASYRMQFIADILDQVEENAQKDIFLLSSALQELVYMDRLDSKIASKRDDMLELTLNIVKLRQSVETLAEEYRKEALKHKLESSL